MCICTAINTAPKRFGAEHMRSDKMKKRTMILSVLMIAQLTACGAKEVPSAPAAVQTEAVTTTASQETAAESSAETAAETTAETSAETTEAPVTSETEATEAPAKAYPEYHSETVKDEIKSDDGAALLFGGTYNSIVFDSGDSYPELGKAVSAYMDTLKANFDEQRDELVGDAKERYTDSPDMFTGEYAMNYSNDTKCTVMRADDKVFSIAIGNEGFGGGAHGWYTTKGVSFDSQTGKELTLSDVCVDIPRLTEVLGKRLEEDYPELSGIQNIGSGAELLANAYGKDLQGYTEQYEDDVYEMPGVQFFFMPDGIMFEFNAYDLGTYAEGAQAVNILFSDEEGLFNEKYVSTGEDFHITADGYSYMRFSDGGKTVSVSYDYEYDDDWNMKGITVKGFGKEEFFEYVPDNWDYRLTVDIERKDGKYNYRLMASNGDVIADITY